MSLIAKRIPWLGVVIVVWLLAAATGLSILWRYDNAAGEAASAPARWPAASLLAHSADRSTLILLAHPQCSCTPASLAELAEVLARARRKPRAYVVFLKPEGVTDAWVQSDLWRAASAIPGVTLIRDDDGREARRFGGATSGQALFYDAEGVLQFAGGITGSRSHAGDNAGRRSLVALMSDGAPERAATSVYGCPLFATSGI